MPTAVILFSTTSQSSAAPFSQSWVNRSSRSARRPSTNMCCCPRTPSISSLARRTAYPSLCRTSSRASSQPSNASRLGSAQTLYGLGRPSPSGVELRQPGVEDLQEPLGVGVLDHEPVHAAGQQAEAADHRITRHRLDRQHQRLGELRLRDVHTLRQLPLPVAQSQEQPVEDRASQPTDDQRWCHHRDVVGQALVNCFMCDGRERRDLLVRLGSRLHDGVDDLVGLSHAPHPPRCQEKGSEPTAENT